MNKFNVLDIFCGAGGFSCGLEQSNFQVHAGIDNDPRALATFAANHKNAVPILYDLSNLDSDLFDLIGTAEHTKVDVLVGGPPCQGFSIAGKRLVDDPRNLLWRAYIKIVQAYSPSVIVLENVPTILSVKNRPVANKILEAFRDMGYHADVKTLLASDFGVPQNRRRTFFVATRKHLPRFKFPKECADKVSVKEAISDLPLLNEGFLGEQEMEYSSQAKTNYQRMMRQGSALLFNHQAVDHKDKTKEIIAMVPDGGNYKNLPSELHSTRKVNIAWTRMNSAKPCFTIDAGHNHHFHYEANRVPTVRECARIQSFPDAFKFIGTRTSQYRQVGNAVPPLLGAALAKSIQAVLDNV